MPPLIPPVPPEAMDPRESRANDYLTECIAQAVAAGVRDVLTDPDVLAQVGTAAIGVLRKRARDEAGGIVLGFLRRLLTNWLVWAIALAWLLKTFGFAGLLQLLQPEAKP